MNGGPINLSAVNLFKADLSNAALIEADLRNAELAEADLTSAKLNQADLRGANLTDAILAGADLADVRFDQATIIGADLSSARNLDQSQIDVTLGDLTTRLPEGLFQPRAWTSGLTPKPDEVEAGDPVSQEAADEYDEAETTDLPSDDDLYAVLGLSRDASAQSIRSAYHARAKAFHPDLNPGDSQRAAAFLRVTNAYQILRDPHLRERYDLGEIDADGEELSSDYYEPEARFIMKLERHGVNGLRRRQALFGPTLQWALG